MAALARLGSVVAFAVWFAGGCGSEEGKGGEAAGGAAAQAGDAGATPASGQGARAVPSGPDPVADIEQPEHAVDRVDDTRWVVDRDVVLQLAVDGIGGWLVTSQVANGYRIDHAPDGSIATRLGFAPGDVVVSVNEIALTDRAAVRRAYALMRESKQLDVVVERSGNTTTRQYLLQDAVALYMPSRSRRNARTRSSAAYEAFMEAMRTGVTRVSATSYEVDRAIVQSFADAPSLLRWAPVRATARRSRSTGIGTSGGAAIGSSPSVLEELGLTKFDVIVRVNDREITEEAELIAELTGLSSALRFTVTALRLGDTITIAYRIVEGVVDRPRLDEAVAAWKVERESDPIDVASDPDATAAQLDRWITKIDDTHYRVDSTAVDDLLQDPTSYAKGARIVPSVKNGRADGFKLYAIRPSSLYAKLGFRNGDTIHAMNGEDLSSPDKALEVYQKLKGATQIAVDVTRRGKPVTLVYEIR